MGDNWGMNVRESALDILLTPVPQDKAARAQALGQSCRHWRQLAGDEAWLDDTQRRVQLCPPAHLPLPGRPSRPQLVAAKSVPSRSPFTLEGRAALLHAICHIEFNAINLALDAVWRFADMPADFYSDWVQIAAEEALHFELLSAHLQSLGWQYGDFDAHDGLWTMCLRTQEDVLARMALVPRTLEARGLDATPQIQEKLRQAGDDAAVRILDRILHDEIGHVAVGNRWYALLCAQRGLDPVSLYPQLTRQYEAPRLRPPFNHAARKAAGFSDAELAYLDFGSD